MHMVIRRREHLAVVSNPHRPAAPQQAGCAIPLASVTTRAAM
jgi:hypothetical protein